jgi:hypothetical protein
MLPGLHDGRILRSPWPFGEVLQGLLCRLFARGCIDRPQRGGDALAVLVAGVLQTVADQMHDAGLHRRAGVGRANRLGQSFQSVDHGDQGVLAAAGLEVIEHLEPELRALGLLNPQAKHIALAVGLDTQRQIDGLVAHHAVATDLYA